MFGRKKRNDDVETDEVIDEDFETTEEAPDDLDAKEAPEEDESSEEEDTSAYRINLDREDGPFDIDEVDLDADDVERIDFGSLIVTPFENMQMQIQLDQTRVLCRACSSSRAIRLLRLLCLPLPLQPS